MAMDGMDESIEANGGIRKELNMANWTASNGTNRAEEIVLNLPTAEGAVFGSYAGRHEPECLDGAYKPVMEGRSRYPG
ncbi:hypothetical protein Dda_3225 [Drechslerella dactyloides]|uniref:Uncharacterized protein n=1 Tax=Drechslerella dactyloides TaxID=74499 RepID=A0AAD6NLB8_DREDA|nr:hypothetical protein Dda_3225 [Drechslerella dactyloides]